MSREVRVPLAALGPGRVEVRPFGRDEAGMPIELLVLRSADGEPRVYRNLCRHLPVPLDGGSRELLDASGGFLLCGTHGALYRLEDGFCVDGPCEGESLFAIPFEIIEGHVVIRRE